MPATPIGRPETGESLLGIEPQLLQQVDPGWRRRLNLFTGRALSDTALDGEQLYRAGLLATLGQAVTPGTVNGLVLSADLQAADPVLAVTPGYGIAASGEDVSLPRTLQTDLSTLAVLDPDTGAVQQSFAAYARARTSRAGAFVLQSVVAQVSGQAFDTGTGPIEVSGNLNASCDQDPQEYAFEDWQIADGVRLAFVPWPSSLKFPVQNPVATWRNRLAYAIFDAEARLGADEQFPWMVLGVPLALVALDATGKPLFIDRSAVVRSGGVPRRRYVLPSAPGSPMVQPALAQARIAQLAEQVSDELGATPRFQNLADICALLPPSGILPVDALNLMNKRSAWFPRNWSLTAAPVHVEELEAVLQTGMLADPIPAAAQAPSRGLVEPVEVLVPLSDELYDPNILVTEMVAPDFQREIDVAAQSRNAVLHQRKAVQLELNALAVALGPNVPVNPHAIDLDAGLTPAEQAGREALPPYFPQPDANADLDRTFGTIGPATWQPERAYFHGQFVYDANRNIQFVQTVVGGTSGVTQPVWNAEPGGATADGTTSPFNWFNAGRGTWQANTAYKVGQFIFDPDGSVQTVQTGGTSGPSSYKWNAVLGAQTADGGITWVNGGPAAWQANHAYTAGRVVVDANGNLQVVQSAGTSGASQPEWATDSGEGTPDGAQLVWIKEDLLTLWEPNAVYALHQCIVDPAGNVQEVTVAGTSGGTQYIWNPTSDQPTTDGTVTWVNGGRATWQPQTNYAAGQLVFAPNGTIQTSMHNGTSGATPPPWTMSTGQVTADGSLQWIGQGWFSSDVSRLQSLSLRPPYAFTHTDANGNHSLQLISADDWGDLADNGLDHFIARLNAKVKRANDLLDLAFLTSQTDIYRFRQNVLTTIDASRLATSPILANIATGATATATAQQLREFFTSARTAPPATDTPPPPAAPQMMRVAAQPVQKSQALTRTVTPLTSTRANLNLAFETSAIVTKTNPAFFISLATPTKQDIVDQSPLVGAQLDVRTLTIAERLTQSPSQEAMFYAVSNRMAFMQALLDLEITVDDLPFLVDTTPAAARDAIPTASHFVSELRNVQTRADVFGKIQTPFIPADVDEAGLFSTGVRAVEQHTQLMRALEARVKLYADFAALCASARASIQSDVQRAHTFLAGLENDLAQARQNVAFTSALLADEQQRVSGVNARRTQVLATSVQVVVYTRGRTLESTLNVPSRQLVPGNVASPVPTCLQESLAVPPELREIVALLRDAPVSWMPSVQSHLDKLGHPSLLQELMLHVRATATIALQSPPKPSSALYKPSVYTPAISGLYLANQQVFRGFQMQRAAFVPPALVNLSLSSQLTVLRDIVAVGDLVSSAAVHAEVAQATSLLIQQISSVAACVYTRANLAPPVDRLAWAEFLRGPGAAIQLRSLAVLPHWNTQPYLDRQQMQLLVDWLFQQIDTRSSAAVAYMSDVVRTCILLASHAPVNAVIAGAVVGRKQPAVGSVVSLTLPSLSVSGGMYVQLYSKGALAAEAVVSDLDSTSVSATVTRVHQPGVYLEANDVAHFTTQPPLAAALRAFAG